MKNNASQIKVLLFAELSEKYGWDEKAKSDPATKVLYRRRSISSDSSPNGSSGSSRICWTSPQSKPTCELRKNQVLWPLRISPVEFLVQSSSTTHNSIWFGCIIASLAIEYKRGLIDGTNSSPADAGDSLINESGDIDFFADFAFFCNLYDAP